MGESVMKSAHWVPKYHLMDKIKQYSMTILIYQPVGTLICMGKIFRLLV